MAVLTHDPTSSRIRVSGAMARRAALVSACLTAGAVAWFAGDPAPALRADPALAQLLRGMAALKVLIALGAVGALWWRFAHPIPASMAAGYVAGAAMLGAGAVLIWQLSFIGAVATGFHVALLGLFLLALKDDGVALSRRP